jgi:hypothetical protein
VPRLIVRRVVVAIVTRDAVPKEEDVKVHVSNPTLIADLAAFLGRAACEARPGRGATIEVTLPHATSDRQARVYLDLYLAAWRGLSSCPH